jgi:predicted nucleic acid-binding protein
MTFLLDTNVLSEWVKPQPNPGVAAWLADVDEDRAFISVITLAELRSDVAALTVGRRRNRLEAWLAQELPTRFEGRVLAVDPAVADAWGRITASARATGRSIHAMDAFLAATAHVHQLTLVTRDVLDFQGAGTPVLCPWSEPQSEV